MTRDNRHKVLLLTSTAYNCTVQNNALHKLAMMLYLQKSFIISNSVCEYVHTVHQDPSKLVETGKEVDCIVLLFTTYPESSTCDTIRSETYFKLILDINRPERTYMVDYFERNWTNRPLSQPWKLREEPFVHRFLYHYCQKYFKRECYSDLNCLPYPEPTLITNNILISRQPKQYDIFCSFPQSHTGLRQCCFQVSRLLAREGYAVLIKNDCTAEEYKKYTQQSHITLDAHGAGQCNHRFLEIISLRSVVCRQKYTIDFYHDYTNEMILEYDDDYTLYTVLKQALSDKANLVAMEKKAYRHYLENHTAYKVSEYLATEMGLCVVKYPVRVDKIP